MDEYTSQFCRCEARVALGSLRCPACGTPFQGRGVPPAAAVRFRLRWDVSGTELGSEVLGPSGWMPASEDAPPPPPHEAYAANDSPSGAAVRASGPAPGSPLRSSISASA